MAEYNQAMFERKLAKLLRKAIEDGEKTLRVEAGELSRAITKKGQSRATTICSALRRYANIEMVDGSGPRRGRCIRTTASGNSTKVIYEFDLPKFTDAVFEKLE
jgi:hypothetical protein